MNVQCCAEGTGFESEDEHAERSGMGRGELGLLQTALAASADRVAGELSGLLLQLGESIADGSDLQGIVQAIVALPALDPRFTRMENVAAVLSHEELHLLQKALEATSQRVVGELSPKLLQLGEHFASGSAELGNIVQAIQNLPHRADKGDGLTNSVGVNTTAAMVLPKGKDGKEGQGDLGGDNGGRSSEFQAELSRMRAGLDAELQAARDEAERQRLRAEEAMRKLEAEARKAGSIISELRDKLKALEALLQRAGLGKEAAAALSQSGLKDFIAGRDVFERLYRDALRRMQAYAETHLLLLNRSAAAFMQTLHDLAAYPVGAVEAALDLHHGPSPLFVMRYGSAPTLQSNRPSPASSPTHGARPQNMRKSKAPETAPQSLRRTKTAEAQVKVRTEQVRNQGFRENPIKRAATEGSALRTPIRTLRQTLFEGLQDHLPAHAGTCGRSSQNQALVDSSSDQEGLHGSPGLAVSASQLVPRPGTGRRSPALAKLAARPASSGCRGKARTRAADDEHQGIFPIHPSLQVQSRSFG